MKISLGTLKDQGEELAAFLEPRVGTKPSVSGDTLEVEDGSIREGVRPRHVKTYIKRFMYMKGVKKNHRVFVSGKELTIQEIELGEEKEEEKKSKEEEKKSKEEEKKSKEESEEMPSKEESLEKKSKESATEKSAQEPKPEKKAGPKKARTKKKTESED
ncbi:MAG: hypothetical protein ACLQEQ_04155 [Nitrososphaerales archaeon]